MKKLGFIVLLLSIPFWSFSQNTPKEKKVIVLMKLINGGDLAKQVMENMIASFKKVYPEVSAEFWDDFVKEVKSDDIEDMLIPIYLKYYTEKEIDDIIVFYKSPTGQKMLDSMPAVMQESMEVGKVWGTRLAEKVIDKLNKNKK